MTCTLNLALQVDIQGADMYLVHITKNTEKKRNIYGRDGRNEEEGRIY